MVVVHIDPSLHDHAARVLASLDESTHPLPPPPPPPPHPDGHHHHRFQHPRHPDRITIDGDGDSSWPSFDLRDYPQPGPYMPRMDQSDFGMPQNDHPAPVFH